MKRLVLIIAILLSVAMFICSMPFMLVLWLLGGDDVIENYFKMLRKVIFGKG